MNVLAIIPARGGSKGIPRKNLRLLDGRPLVAHAIAAARAARSVSRVVVSTDDAEIAQVSQCYGAEIVDRPPEISGDAASSESALLHALDHLEKTEAYVPELVVFLQCTSPLTLPEDIDGAVETLLREDADSVLAATPFHYFLWRTEPSGEAVGINHDERTRQRRQEREPQYLETGAVYVLRTAGFREAGHRFFGRTRLFVIPPERCLEIDEQSDFKLAELLVLEQNEGKIRDRLPARVSALVLDFDGVMTDNRVIVSRDGSESVVCDRSDGWGLAQLTATGIPILVLSTERNAVVSARCSKLGIECMQGVGAKRPALENWLSERNLPASEVVYVGNDENDVDCLRAVGCGVVVADAHPSAVAAARGVLLKPGGKGAVREICDLLLEHVATGSSAAALAESCKGER